MDQPETSFVDVGAERVAFQVFGDGPLSTLHLGGWLGSVDSVWEHAGHLRHWRMATENAQIVAFDHRGLGVSDPVPESRLGDINERVEDCLAVLDAVEMDRVNVIGEADGVSTAVRLAVEFPDRVDRLILVNGMAKGSRGDGYEYGMTAEQLDRLAQRVRAAWGTGEVLSAAAPHLADDRAFAGRFERLAARPSTAAALMRNLARVDVRHLLDQVTAPTLVVYSGDIVTTTAAESQYLAQRIPNARFVERSSSSFYWGDGLVDELNEWLVGDRHSGDRHLATVLFTDIVESTRGLIAVGDEEWRRTLDFLDELVAKRAGRFGGRVVKQTGDGHLVEFTLPSDAADTALALCRDAPTLGVSLRAGIHTGEIERRENGDIGGLSVHIAARIAALADGGEVVVSRTVADLLGAGGYSLDDRGEHELKGVPGTWKAFTVTRRSA